jgi:hypothetical protein
MWKNRAIQIVDSDENLSSLVLVDLKSLEKCIMPHKSVIEIIYIDEWIDSQLSR